MVKVIFYNLLRSKYNISEVEVNPGTINNIINQILNNFTNMKESDFKTAVVFYKGIPIHNSGFDTRINDRDEIIITHFVGGG
jgi:molybdopterin converting factor small subunit